MHLNPIASRLLYRHYVEHIDPLDEPLIATRGAEDKSQPHLEIVRMLATLPGIGLVQVIGTIGASARRLPKAAGAPARRFEFVTFVPAAWDLADAEHMWVLDLMANLADYACETIQPLSIGHTVDMNPGEGDVPEDVTMAGAALLPPDVIRSEGFPLCRTGLFSQTAIIHMMPVTREEMRLSSEAPDKLRWLMQRFYPEGDQAPAILCQRSR